MTSTIVQRVASMTGQDIDRLPRLYDTIDPDALKAIIDSSERSATSLLVTFDYAGHRVTVSGDGTVRVDTGEK